MFRKLFTYRVLVFLPSSYSEVVTRLHFIKDEGRNSFLHFEVINWDIVIYVLGLGREPVTEGFPSASSERLFSFIISGTVE